MNDGTIVINPYGVNYDTDEAAIAAGNQFLSNNTVEFCYYVASPTTYHLSSLSELLTTLKGVNNFWVNCGDTTLDYCADTKLYIEKLTQPEEDDMVANANIASGTFFMVGNSLYISTAAILAGDPIKPGTNCTLTNLAAALNAINS